MKNITILFAFICLTIFKLDSQVTGVNYWINYNDVDSVFDCYIIITEGSAVTSNQRKLLTNQFTIVVPSGNTVSVVDNYNPINNNENYTGTTPVNWNLSSIIQNPISSPGNDIIAFTAFPFGQHFNNLNVNDTLKLFSLTVSPEICPNTIRLFENNIDPNSSAPGMQFSDFSQHFALGFPSEAYEANSPQGGIQSPIGQLPNISPVVGDEFLLIPNYSGTWISNNPTVATVDANGLVDVINTGYVTFSFTNSFGCENTTHALFIPEPEPPIISLESPYTLCGNDTITLSVLVLAGSPPYTYLWSNGSNNDSIEVSPLNNSIYSVTVSDNFGNSVMAFSEINVYPLPIISISGSDSICVGETTTLTPNSGGTWQSSNNAIANITNSGVVTGIDGGKVSFIYTSSSTGCSSLPSDSVTIHDLPNVVLTGQDIIFVNDSTYLSPQAGGTWASSDNDIAIISDDGIVTGISPGFVTFTFTSNTTDCSATSQTVQIINQLPPLSCNVGTIVFSIQDEVDAFPVDYPGCTIIDGNIGITGSVENLDSLIQITKITGGLQILNSSTITDIGGISNIEWIGDNLLIQNNPNLDLSIGFNALQFIGGNFIVFNIEPGFVAEFPELDTINGNLRFDSPQVDLSGLNNLNFIGGNVEVKEVTYLGSISNLDTIYGDLNITFCDIEIINFPNLKYIQGNLQISNNQNLNLISGFNQLIKIENELAISNNNVITDISAFVNLISTIELDLFNNPFLTNINGLDHSIDFGSLHVNQNPFLSACNVVSFCEHIWQNRPATITNNAPGCTSVLQVQQACGLPQDSDGDNVNDLIDNCITIPNTNQADANNDGEGDVCDSDSDTDNDTVIDSLDNCVTTFNPNQADANNDGQGDVCDNNSDSDSDGRNDNIDNCPSLFNPDQRDCNNNGIGDVCEAYVDNDCDGITNSSDNCPETYNPYQIDYNNNSVGDACESFPKIGINTTQPKTEMHLSYSNVYLDHPEKGLIVKDHNGQCYKTVVEMVNNKAELKLVVVACP